MNTSLHARAAHVLGWSVKDAQSMSLATLREMVRPLDPGLAAEMTEEIRTGRVVRGSRVIPTGIPDWMLEDEKKYGKGTR